MRLILGWSIDILSQFEPLTIHLCCPGGMVGWWKVFSDVGFCWEVVRWYL
jgi:hypothetical protein